ncbi:MAG: hypothetical protein EOM87_04495 [Clostridia bacterium]|nr:hypothetical protein [Clostridia bacterium]
MDTALSATKKYVSAKEIAAYSLGLFGMQSIVGMVNSYQAQFYNKTMGTNFFLLGIIMLIARVSSALADPIFGNIIDKSRFRNGKLRPFILISLVPFFIMTIALFIVVPFRGAGLYIYIFVTFLLWCMAMTFADIPSQSMLCALSPLPAERNKVAGVSNIWKNVGLSFSVVLMPIVCIVTNSEGGEIYAKQYMIVAVLIAVLGGLALSMIFFFNKEKVPFQRNKSSLKEIRKMLKVNKPMVLLIISLFLGFARGTGMIIQAQAAHSLVGTITVFGKSLSGDNAIILLGFTSALSSIVGMAISPTMTRKWGERTTFIAMAIYGGIITSIAFTIFLSGVTSLAFLLISLLFVGLMYGPHSFMTMIMVADCVDYYEWKTGIRSEGMHYSVLSFVVKITTALSVVLGLGLIQLSGYSANAETIAVSTKNTIYFSFVMLPGLSCLLSMIPIFFYKLVGKEKHKIALELAEMRANKNLSAEENQICANEQ